MLSKVKINKGELTVEKNVIFDVSKETVAELAGQIKDKYDDSILVLAPFSGQLKTYAPTRSGKYKGYFRINTDILIPEDAIKGENALSDFGAFVVMRLPKARVADHLIDE
jgi:hypothetical protein